MLRQIVTFSRNLHDAGVVVNSANLIDLCRCLAHIDIRKREDFHATARATLVSNQHDLACFDQLFSEFWDKQHHPHSDENRRSDESEKPDKQEGLEKRFSTGDPDIENPEDGKKPLPAAYSAHERLMKKDLATMSDREIEQARRLIVELVAVLANYKSLRRIADRRGLELDFRKMLRRHVLYGWDGMELAFRKRRIRKTRLMLLCDVSGSMERYSSFLIQFIYALNQQIANLEIAVFSTRMTVISEYLKRKSVEESLNQVSEAVHDWAGGTNIGGCIREFNDRFAHEMLRSRTVVIILSDGWDRGDAYLMREEMEHLRRRAHKLLWMNPLLGSSNYQPLCRGMQTALPYLDYFLPAHNLESLARLIRQLRSVWQ